MTDIRIFDEVDPAEVTRLGDALHAFNIAATGIDDARELFAVLHDDSGELYAGVHGGSWGATCWIDLLWVRDDRRGEGVGTALMHAVEAEARRRGCAQIALSTHSFQAPDFYRHLGFEQVGELPEYPRGHSDVLLRRRVGTSESMPTTPVSLLLVSGSLRAGSTNAAALQAAATLAPIGVTARLYDGMSDLPHFNPDDDAEGQPVHPVVAAMRDAVARADALLICTPEYAGALPGALKNLLEWTVGDAGTYEKPVAWINVAGPASPTGAADAHESLRKVLGYVHADVVEAACRRIPLTRQDVGADGLITNEAARQEIGLTITALAEHVRHGVDRSGRVGF